MKKICLALVLIVSIFFSGCGNNSIGKNLDLTIVHTNDVHGRIIFDEANKVAGYSKMNSYISKLKDQNKNVMLVDSGDVLHGQPIVTIPKGEPVVSLMNLMGYNYFVPGNHDFNYGFDRLEELSKSMSYKVLAANLYKSDGCMPFEENDLITVDNVNIGIFGLVTPETSVKTNTKNIEDLVFEDPIKTAKEQVKKLKEKGADLIIAIAHLGINDENIGHRSYDVRDSVDGIDLIIDGHSHSSLNQIEQVQGKATITSTGAYSENLGIVKINMQNGKKNIVPQNVLFDELKDLDNNPEIDMLINKINENISPLLDKVIGNTQVYLEGKRTIVRAKETNLTRLVTESILNETKADIVLLNGGGFRDSVDIGDIKQRDILKVFPFGDYIITKSVKGEDIMASLEYGLKTYPSPSGNFPQLAGAICTIDESAPNGSKVKSIIINGEEIDPQKNYILATNDFIANGGDGYDLIKNSLELNHLSALDEIFIKYIKEIGTITQTTIDNLKPSQKIINPSN